MAIFPCDRHGTRVFGPNRGVYVAYGSGGDLLRHYLRLCAAHSREVETLLDPFLVDPNDGTYGSNTGTGVCASCRKPIIEPACQVFVTHYVAQNERKDYWTQLHDGCDLPPILKPGLNTR